MFRFKVLDRSFDFITSHFIQKERKTRIAFGILWTIFHHKETVCLPQFALANFPNSRVDQSFNKKNIDEIQILFLLYRKWTKKVKNLKKLTHINPLITLARWKLINYAHCHKTCYANNLKFNHYFNRIAPRFWKIS